MNSFPSINMKATGENIRQLRTQTGISVKNLQELLGLDSPQTIYKWQRGENLPTIENLMALSELFGVPIEEIIISNDNNEGDRQ